MAGDKPDKIASNFRSGQLLDMRNPPLQIPDASPSVRQPVENPESEQEVANDMQSTRMQRLSNTIKQANANFENSEKAQEAGQALGALLSKSGWGAAILFGVKWIIKIIHLFAGDLGVSFFVTTWVIWVVTLPMHLIIDIMLPLIGGLITWASCMVFAIPLSSQIYPKLKPYIDGILKGSTLAPIKK